MNRFTGKDLVRYRRESGLSQAKLAARCSMTRDAIAKIEQENRSIYDVEQLQRFADVLGIPYERVFPQKGEQQAQAPVLDETHLLTAVPTGTTSSQREKAVYADFSYYFEMGMRLLLQEQRVQGWSSDEFRTRVLYAIRSSDEMDQLQNGETYTRRQSFSVIVGLPAILLGLAENAGAALAPIIAEEALPLYTASVPAAFALYFAGGQSEVERALPGYLSHLATLAQQPSKHQQPAAALGAQAYALDSLLLVQHEDLKAALKSSQQAIEYAKFAADPNIIAATLLRQAWIYWYLKRPAQILQLHQQAMQYINQITPLQKGRIYIGLAETYAELGKEQEALRFIGLAEDTFPDHPEADPAFLYTHYDDFSMLRLKGLAYLHLDQPQDAWNTFEQAGEVLPTTLVPHRVQLNGHQADVSVALGDLDMSSVLLESAVNSALSVGNDMRYREAYDIYGRMLARWGNERRVKDLRGLFQR